MSIPLPFFSDASLEYGNHNPKEIISAAKSNGYSRTVIIDDSTMSAAIKYLDGSASLGMGAIVGATVPVSCPEIEHLKWLKKNKARCAKLEEISPNLIDYTVLEKLNCITHILFGTIGRDDPLSSTPKKLRTSLNKLIHSGFICDHDTFFGTSLIHINEAFIKGNGIFNVIYEVICFIFDKKVAENLCDEENLKIVTLTLQKLDFSYSLNRLTFVAKDLSGYYNLLSLVSRKAEIKSNNIKNGECETEAISLSDIDKYRGGLIIIDTMTPRSFADDVCLFEDNKDVQCIKDVLSQIDYFGVSSFHSKEKIDYLKKSDIKAIPFPVSKLIQESDYDNYCIKVAIHRGESVFGRSFEAPERGGFIKEHDEEINSIKAFELEDFDIDFWDSIGDTEVKLGEVFLPGYDMPVIEIIKYGLTEHNVEFSFNDDDTEEATRIFDDFIFKKYELVGTKDAFRQRKLNDFCLLKLTMEGLPGRLEKRFGDDAKLHREEYLTAIKHEYSVIESMGFSGYFLIEFDMVSYARQVGVPVGPGRGSAAGSLIVYCLEITDVDPIEHDLQFERFLNPERVSMPDIDVDFGDGGEFNRSDVLKYVRNKYQQKGVNTPSSCQISNISRYQLKSAIDGVIRALGLTMDFTRYVKFIIKSAETSLGINSAKNITWDELTTLDFVAQRLQEEPMLYKVFSSARVITGKMSTFGVHAGGIVISPTVITDFSTLVCDAKGNLSTEFDKDDIERAGLIKFDVLGSMELSVIAECARQIKENKGIDIDPRNLDFEDPAVYELISSQKLANVFQLKSAGMIDLVGRIKPKNMGELADLSALYRPGALDSGMVTDYVEVKNGTQQLKYDHPALEKVTKNTYGCIVYQEQVMSIVRELAGYSLGQADLLRRAMGKKKIEEMVKQRSVYTGRAMAFWREHYIQVCEGRFDFDLDVNLTNIKPELDMLGLGDVLNDDGYLANLECFVKIMKTTLKLNESDLKLLQQRTDDFKYVVMLFQSHYMDRLKKAIPSMLVGVEESKQEEVFVRLYYVLSQYVRFNQIFNKVEKFAGYGFNKSHAISYSLVTFQDAYFKLYFTEEFYSATLSFTKLKEFDDVILEAKHKMGIKILPPNVNKSKDLFSVESPKCVRYGLSKLKSVSSSGNVIYQERINNGVYYSIFNFLLRMSKLKSAPDATALGALATVGAFDQFIPKRIMGNSAINGREFCYWLISNYTKSKDYTNSVESFLHTQIDSFDEDEFFAYLSAIMINKSLSSMPEVLYEQLNPLLSGAETAKKRGLLFEDVNKLMLSDIYIGDCFYNLFLKLKNGDISNVEIRMLRCLVLFKGNNDEAIRTHFNEFLMKVCEKSITETLNEERDIAGFYITSTPLKVLKIAEQVESEPPGSVIDGCPVSVSTIDDSFDGQTITTYGIVRNLVVKTTKKEDSQWYGEKMMFFQLDDGVETLNCMMFGTKPTNAWEGKVIENDMIALFAGKIKKNNKGLTLNIEVVKRYYPVVDKGFHTAIRKNNKWTITKPS